MPNRDKISGNYVNMCEMNLKGIFQRITLQGDALPELKEPLFRQELVAFTGAGISVESGVPSYIGTVTAHGVLWIRKNMPLLQHFMRIEICIFAG